MALEEVENLSMPRCDSNLAIGSNSNTGVTLLSRKRKLTSVVWNSFEKVIVDGQSYTICKHCNSRLKAGSKNRNKNLHVHLDRCIKRKDVDIKQQLLEVERRGCGTEQIGGFTFDQNISREKLACAIILHEYPLSIVDHVALKDFATIQLRMT